MVLYNSLDQSTWAIEDFTDENTLSFTGTIYTDKGLTNVFDGTGYTLTFRFKNHNGDIIEENTDDLEWVIASSGTYRMKPDSGRFIIEGNGEFFIRLEKSGTQITAIGVNGSADLTVIQA